MITIFTQFGQGSKSARTPAFFPPSLIFELVICVKQALKIVEHPYSDLGTRVSSARSVAHVFFVNEEFPHKRVQMRCGW